MAIRAGFCFSGERAKIKPKGREKSIEVMTSQPPDNPTRRRRRGKVGVWLVMTLGIVLLAIAAVVLLFSRDGLTAPNWATAQIENRINRELQQGSVTFGEVQAQLAQGAEPVIRLGKVTVANAFGAPVARFDKVEAAVTLSALLRGQLQPRAVRITGGTLRLRRDSDGTVDLALGPEADFASEASVAQVLADIEKLFSTDALSMLDVVSATQVGIRFEDDVSGRVFSVDDGRLTLFQSEAGLRLSVAFALKSGDNTADALLNFYTDRGDPGARISAEFRNLQPIDLALQAPQLDWLSGLTSPISGSARLRIEASGKLASMDGTLALGPGSFAFDERTRPISIEEASTAFTYQPDGQRLTFESVKLSTSAGKITANGHGFLSQGSLEDPRAIVGQVQVPSASIASEGVLSGGLDLTDGALDAKIELNPFSIHIGQFTATSGQNRINARGKLDLTDDRWSAALDVSAKTMSRNGFLAFWPIELKKKTRTWLDRNITKADLRNVELALRWSEEQPVEFATSFEFVNATISYLRTLPPIRGAIGRGTILREAMSIELEEGTVVLPEGPRIDVAGSVMNVGDLRPKQPVAQFDLKTDSPVSAALTLLDKKPFRFLTKAGMSTDFLSGHAQLNVGLTLPLIEKLKVKDVLFDVTGTVTDARSETLVPGRVISVPRLSVSAQPDRLVAKGKGAIDNTRFDGAWTQLLGPEHAGQSAFEGSVELDDAMAQDFRLGFPKGTFTGAAQGLVALDIKRGAPVAFTLTSDLNRLGFSLSELGWTKPRAQTGRLLVEGFLGAAPSIDKLELNAAGLSAQGKITLKPGAGLERAEFSNVSLGSWLNAPVTLTGRGAGRTPSVSVNGGVIDIRKTTFGRGGGGGRSNAGPITLNLDRLQVSDGIALNGFAGTLTAAGGVSGTFRGRVNNGPTIQGTLAQAQGGTAIRIRSPEAGDVLRAANVLKNARGGDMDLILTPRSERGAYTGRLTVKNVRLVGASAMADLLNAISVVGLLDQLNGPGIQFNDVDADFVLTPDRVVVTRSAAVGPSMGISLDGTYMTQTEAMDMQGVISPIYLLNGIGQIFTRRGEGLFGFNFRLVGSAKNPKVQVNPLSILTPGMFREIFRRPPPQVPTQ